MGYVQRRVKIYGKGKPAVNRTDRRRASQAVPDGQGMQGTQRERHGTIVGGGRQNLRAQGKESKHGHQHRRPHHTKGSSPVAHGVYHSENDDDLRRESADSPGARGSQKEKSECRWSRTGGRLAGSGGDVMMMSDDIPARPGSSGARARRAGVVTDALLVRYCMTAWRSVGYRCSARAAGLRRAPRESGGGCLVAAIT
jgi:hypothetical protein